jgi:hypothetical protein
MAPPANICRDGFYKPAQLLPKNVYHDDNECTEGNNIEKQHLASGTAGRPKCEHCQRLG